MVRKRLHTKDEVAVVAEAAEYGRPAFVGHLSSHHRKNRILSFLPIPIPID